MTTEDALLAAVLASPADDLPRLVLADHYEGELGQPERAEFIRVQIRIAELRAGCSCGECVGQRGGRQHTNGGCAVDRERIELPDGSSRKAFLRQRERELWDAVSLAMREKCMPFLDNLGIESYAVSTVGNSRCAVVRRGFPEVVYCTLAEWCGGECSRCRGAGYHHYGREIERHSCSGCLGTTARTTGIGPQIVKRHPVERVVLTDREPHQNPAGVFLFNRVGGAPEHPSELPTVIFDLMEGQPQERQTSRTHTVKFYPSKEDALSALSAALIAWAKSQADPARIHTSPVSVDVTG